MTTGIRTERADEMVNHCVKCRTKQRITGVVVTRTKTGTPMLRGTCSVCGTASMRFIRKDDPRAA